MRLAVPVKLKKLNDKAQIPVYMTEGAAALDLVATEIEYLDENKVIVKFGFESEFSNQYKILLQPRSSFTFKSWIMANSPGIIDSDYRGEWQVRFEAVPVAVHNETFKMIYEEFPYKVGDRIVQATIEVNVHLKAKFVENLTDSVRGNGGFGSTGK
jgi:dUTP pyrophosphatase